MSNTCPEFETLSRFADGALGGLEEGELLAHVAGCAACRATLQSIEQVDDLLTLTLPASSAASRRFRLLRPALLPLAGALLFALTLGYVLTKPSGVADSPMAVAELTPPAALPPAEPVANVFLHERFQGAQLSPDWKSAEAGSSNVVDDQGRRSLQLSAHPGGKKRWGLVTTASDFSASEGVSFDIDYRIPKPQKGGRMQILLQTKAPKAARGVLRWSRTFDEELLEVQTDGRSKPTVLWSSKASPSDAEWHQMRVTLLGNEVLLHRDGIELTRKPHGLSLDRAGLTLGSTLDKRSRDTRDTFECHVGRVLIRREDAQ